jgi:GAF domain-containing protein
MKANNDYFKTMRTISRAFGTTLDRDELLKLIIDSAVKIMKVKAASLFLIDQESERFVRVAGTGLSRDYLRSGLTQPQKLTPILLKEGFLFARDATTDPRLEHHRAKKAEGIASILAVPIMVKGKLLGGLSLFTTRKRDFSAEEIDFVTALAEQGGMAIEHARLFDRLKQNTAMFLDLSASINSSLDLNKVLHILSANVADTIGVKGAAIRLLDEKSQTLELAASYGLSEAYLNKGPISAAQGPDQELMQGKPLVLRNAKTDKSIKYKKEMAKEGIVSILSVPIKTKDEVIGVLRLYSGVQREFAEDEILLIMALAHQGGLAIQNATLYTMLKQDMDDLKDDMWSHRSWF